MGFFKKLFGSSSSTGVKAETLGVLDLTGGREAAARDADSAALRPFFARVVATTDRPPECTWLMVYCTIGEDGRIAGYSGSLRDLVDHARAPFVVVATPNTATAYRNAAPDTPHGQANLIMTLDRKGDAFARFFVRLLAEMKDTRQPLPAAWNAVAPQARGAAHDAPDTIAICDLGGVTLE
jgi:hypothetical protein